MELKRHFDFRVCFVCLYLFAFIVYVIIGLQSAKATEYEVSSHLSIPSVNLVSDVTELKLNNGKLDTPDTIVGSFSKHQNKTLLIGHSMTVFQNLDEVELRQEILYNNKTYIVNKIEFVQKEKISMGRLLREEEEDTLVIMTCAGKILDGNDATHRLLITALAQ